MKRNISYKKGLWPAPVYEAHFSDNTVGRMSFWSRAGKPKENKPLSSDVADRLTKLRDLLDRKLITPEEYQTQRKKILDRI